MHHGELIDAIDVKGRRGESRFASGGCLVIRVVLDGLDSSAIAGGATRETRQRVPADFQPARLQRTPDVSAG
jgi:hypothetical protein